MDFALWLMKRAWEPVVDIWNCNDGAYRFVLLLFSLAAVLSIDVIIGLCLGRTGDDRFYPITLWLWLGFWVGMSIFFLSQYLPKLYAQYRTEHPQPEKPKRKNDEKEQARQSFGDYFESVTYCDGCAKQTNDLTAVPIAGIGISHQCPKCTPIIEEYERRYQEGEMEETK